MELFFEKFSSKSSLTDAWQGSNKAIGIYLKRMIGKQLLSKHLKMTLFGKVER